MQYTTAHEDPFIFLPRMPGSCFTLEDGKLVNRTSLAVKFFQALPPLHPFIIHSQEGTLVCVLEKYGVRKRSVEMIPPKLFVDTGLCPAVVEVDYSLRLVVNILGNLSSQTSQEENDKIISLAAKFKCCSDFLISSSSAEKRYVSTEIEV